MGKCTTERNVVELRFAIQEELRRRVLETIDTVLREEVEAVLGSERYERTGGRQGYRHGKQVRRITTEYGPQDLTIPRARVRREDGTTEEFQSEVVPRYARRTKKVDEAILGAYLAGANTRRIRKALEPLLGTDHLSKSAVSRVVVRVKKLFESWDERDLSGEEYRILFLDGLNLKVRLVRRVITVPVLAVLGVTPGGQKQLVALRLAMQESGASWSGLVEDLKRRGLRSPMMVISDGHRGLVRAVELWPEADVQRCTRHKLQNLLEHCPKHAHGELRRDWHRIVQAKDGLAARQAYDAFLSKWSRLCPAVARSLEEAGLKLLTFYKYPRAMWRSIRSTNILENVNREFRRRTKTQGSFCTEASAITLLFALVAFGQIRLQRINGYRALARLTADTKSEAA
jgi:putative transposase